MTPLKGSKSDGRGRDRQKSGEIRCLQAMMHKDRLIRSKLALDLQCWITIYVDWGSYHIINCNEHNMCGAFQGHTSEEDLQCLLDAVNVSMESTQKHEVSSSPAISRALDTDIQPISVTIPMDNIQPLFGSVNTPMCSDNMMVVDSTDIYEILDDIFTFPDIVPLCCEPEMSSSITVGHTLNMANQSISAIHLMITESMKVVDPTNIYNAVDNTFTVSYFVICELYGLDEDTTLDDAIQHGYECQITYEEFQEISGMFKFLCTVQAIAEEHQTIADFFVCAAQGPHLSDMCIECGVQCDIESQLDPGDMGTDTTHTTLPNCSFTHDYEARLRARNVKKVACATVQTQNKCHENLVLQHDVVKDWPRTGQPVIFAGSLVQCKKKIHLFLLDPMRDDFIQNHTTSQYNALLNVA
ncbi:hypothetical protein BDR06DRAFT_966816 [Suillus hirtellus]|nr:hypothetical protein BDR06DRAFT_966816 [Suillus hirtellus]